MFIKRWHHEERVDDPFSECEGISFPRQPCHSSIRLWMLLVIQSPSSRSQQWVFRRVPLSQGWLNYLVEGWLTRTIPIIEESMFFSYFNFFEFDFSVQNATLLSKLSSTLNIMISHTTIFFFIIMEHTHTSQPKKNLFLSTHAHGIHGSSSVFYYLGNRWPDRMVDWPLTTQIQYQSGDSIL